ncbi:MAG: hypothetical protein JST82_06245 [Bacteroidetes bacterium]|nr:hypothetical protein [Bacteroidota bacterium]
MKAVMIAFCLCVFSCIAVAQQKNEEALVNQILMCFAKHDDSAYMKLFPKAEELITMANSYHDTNVIDSRRINNIRRNPQRLQQFDPLYNPDIVKDFEFILQKGIDSGLHWRDLVLARFEFEKSILSKELVGLEKIIPYRLQGYIFVQDLLTRRVFCITVKDVHGFNGKWYGGRIVNLLEAESIEEYYVKLAKEKKVLKDVLMQQMYALSDTAGAAEDSAAVAAKKAQEQKKAEEDDDDKKHITTEVIERKLYTGTFDKEIGLELYVRGLKGNCPQAVCGWEAIYKFEDKNEYVILEVTKGPNGKLVFTDEDNGVMELTIKNGKATGEWTSFTDKTTFDVDLTEKIEVKNRTLFKLDAIIEDSQ